MNQLNNGFTLFLSLLVEAMPFLLLGVLFSSLLLFFIDERKLVEKMPTNPLLGALFGSMIGFLFPVCECGNVPVARRLLMQGVPTPVAIGFLLAAPTINPIVIWATWTAFRDQPEIVVLRVVLSLAIATIIGFVFSFQRDLSPFLQPAIARYLKYNPPTKPESKRKKRYQPEPEPASANTILQSGTYILGGKAGISTRIGGNLNQTNTSTSNLNKPLADKLRLVLDNIVQELRELGGVMVLGSAIAAAIQVLAPRDIILSLGAGPITSILAMLVLAAVVSICSTVDSFFALSFASTFTSGSLLAFLVFGPMIDIKGVGLMLSIFKPKALIYLFVLAGQLTLLFTLILNLHVM
ncbi:permease [Sphaerospermopsis aphanizomenoides BCCUSP55]|uniref:permease n=1 Tax=Sphaerospermopsis aphanizomenoides TaxID=459663 RepID=UPI001903F03A|nr:permease [Sphaerospermopsis aphanizomenoides]MBK1988632.1 permease [Sphaerospermopsis aphanizomenoides BCCUSP55]